MAETGATGVGPGSPAGGPATPPPVAPWLVLYTLGRAAILGVLIAVLWVAGLPGVPALLFGFLLSTPVAYVLLRSVREPLTEALAARAMARRAAKEDLRARLTGDAGAPPGQAGSAS